MFGVVPYESKRNQVACRRPRDVFDYFFGDNFVPMFAGNTMSFKTDVRETDKEYIIEADLPGVAKGDIKLDVNEDLLTISVERNEEKNEEKGNYIRRERRFGSSSRSFNVGNTNQDEVEAKFENGILSIRLPKLQEEQAAKRYIDIH